MSDRDATNEPGPSEHAEKQRDPRINVRIPARVSSIDAERDPSSGRPYFRVCEETCLNVSRGGVMVVTPDPMETDRRVLVELDIPGTPAFQAVGRVAWSRVLEVDPSEEQTGTGIEFTGASREHFSRLDEFLRRQLRRRTQPTTAGVRTPARMGS